ncbi:MAG: hypothetical protein M1840_001412 [Geoglossum simile]|nr:MAG: hypothetical protein M1840_001412 [Geoglossum simile]
MELRIAIAQIAHKFHVEFANEDSEQVFMENPGPLDNFTLAVAPLLLVFRERTIISERYLRIHQEGEMGNCHQKARIKGIYMIPPYLEVILRDRISGSCVLSGLSVADCQSLRLVNREIQTYVDAAEGDRLFGALRVKEGGVSERMRKELAVIGKYCGEVVVEVGLGKQVGIEEGEREELPRRFFSRPSTRKRASPLAKHPPTTSPSHWARLFVNLPNLHTLVISSAQKDASWTPNPHLDETIIALRNAFETANLPHVHTLRLHPIHPLGLLHLRWTIAFGDADWIAGKFWSRITTLVMHVLKPGREAMGARQRVMFGKILHSYLAAFSKTLVRLEFSWVGGVGVCPLLLETIGPGRLFSAPGLRMETMRSIWLANVTLKAEEVKVIMEEKMMGCEEVLIDGVVSGAKGSSPDWAKVQRIWVEGRRVWKYERLESGDSNEGEGDADSITRYNGIMNHYNEMG